MDLMLGMLQPPCAHEESYPLSVAGQTDGVPKVYVDKQGLPCPWTSCHGLSVESILIQGENGSKGWGTKSQELQPRWLVSIMCLHLERH